MIPAPPSAEPEPAAGDAAPSADTPCGNLPLTARVEALLISTDRPLAEGRLAETLGLEGSGVANDVRAAIEELNASYRDSGRAFSVERLAGGWQIMTRSEYGPLVSRGQRDRAQSRLSPAAMETLSILSYRQPILRAEIEAIRGVACGEVLRGLLERRLVKIVGRAEEIGRPMLYGTTKEFLKLFGLSSLEDLPAVEGLEPPGSRPRRTAKPPVPEPPESPEATEVPEATEAPDALPSPEPAAEDTTSESDPPRDDATG